MEKNDTYWMNQCLRLAKRGTGMVSPNPLVGAVIVKNGRKIGEGFHERWGGAHAEINAINHSLSRKHTLHGSTIYINLEPCSHSGKTPPCVDAIIRHKFSRVVIASVDANPLVSGKGIARLKEHGIIVKTGVCKKEAIRLNEKFFSFIVSKIPFIALKAAQTQDGFIAKENGVSRWITNEYSRKYVHQLRSEYDAVLVGAVTVLKDDPELTVRSVHGRDPVRIVVDGKFTVPTQRKIFNRKSRTIIYIMEEASVREAAKKKELTNAGVMVVPIRSQRGMIDLQDILSDLASKNIASILVEGGSRIYSEFLKAKAADKLYLFTSRKKFFKGIKTFNKISVSYKKKLVSERYFRSDRLQEFRITFS